MVMAYRMAPQTAVVRVITQMPPWMAAAGLRPERRASMSPRKGTPAEISATPVACRTAPMTKKNTTDSSTLCRAKLWPMAMGQ